MKYAILMLGIVGGSLSPIFVRFSTAPSMLLVFYRVIFATILLTPYVIWRHGKRIKLLARKEWMLCSLAGVFLGLHFTSYFEALNHTTVAPVAVLVNTEAIFVTLGTVLFFKANLSKKAWFAVLLTFAGSAIIAMADAGTEGGTLLGSLLALAGAIFGAIYTMLGTVCRRSDIPTMVYSYFVYASAAITVLVFILISGMEIFDVEPINYLTTLGMAVCCTIGGHSIYSWGLKFLPASFVSTAKMLGPVFASIWALLLFNENPGVFVCFGGALVILGIIAYGFLAEKN